ncbi:methyltransferase-like protein 22 [Aplysia californica]|uniref:Methyltransferase-like protein 22 n=1 Tax=Aplysia californica TaxID=6500 RepID=A0ABM0JLP3_APLCA|nr:methyltransferase-like protein 22 [Aplysia californica]
MEEAEQFQNKVLSTIHVSERETNPVIDSEITKELETYVSRFFFSLPFLGASQGTVREINSSGGDGDAGDFDTPTTIVKSTDRIVDDNLDTKSKERSLCSPIRVKLNCSDDQSGDCKIKRRKDKEQKEVLTIEHKMATSLQGVGFQVWSGALLLCDYLLLHQTEVCGSHVLDLGSGPGLTAIIAALFADTVICTDYSSEIVHLAQRNWERNCDLLPALGSQNMIFKVLDWNNDSPFDPDPSCSTDHYNIKEDDAVLLQNINLILAAEVVYDDDITDAFFKTIYYLLVEPPSKHVLVSLERRVLYSTRSHEVCSPAYEHFRENLDDLTSVDEGPVRFLAQQLSTDFPACFDYDRFKELELWKISSVFPS